ncbi:four-carbon acid sugar kinase family protein [Robbsia sp. KACC 23696]|uniref:four-carbon acid sugar kinase family protein n=1 Tax=Robbsia sp. KACC 23696 TaxID=3149231 RepID=UPI00325C1111
MSEAPAYGFYGDDFTGATDTLAHLSRAGFRTMLFFNPPTDAQLEAVGPLDAIGVASSTRAMGPAAIKAQLTDAGARFAALGVRLFHYKICSTFDSSPDIGSIGAAVGALRPFFPNPLLAIVGGQPGPRRYCVFGNLFAASTIEGDGSASVVRIDRHPTMANHPSTPMHEADLRQHLAAQGLSPIALVDCLSYRPLGDVASIDHDSDTDIRAKVAPHLAPDATAAAVLFDVIDDSHLAIIGRVLAHHSAQAPLLAVGASSVAQAWAFAKGRGPHANLADGTAQAKRPNEAAVPDLPVFAFAGSLSPMTTRQIAAAHSYSTVEIDPDNFNMQTLGHHVDDIVSRLNAGKHVLAFTGRSVRSVASRDETARCAASLVAAVLASTRVRRLVVAGGDTSSFIVQELGGWGLSYVATVSEGVAMCRLHADAASLNGLEIALKGGQMGGIDFFEQVLTSLGPRQ